MSLPSHVLVPPALATNHDRSNCVSCTGSPGKAVPSALLTLLALATFALSGCQASGPSRRLQDIMVKDLALKPLRSGFSSGSAHDQLQGPVQGICLTQLQFPTGSRDDACIGVSTGPALLKSSQTVASVMVCCPVCSAVTR